MTLEELKAEYTAILNKGKTENRSLTADETSRLDTLKAEITRLENEAAAKAALQKREEELRSIAAAQETIRQKLNGTGKGAYLRSITKGSQDVGNKEVIADVVRVYQQTSPLYASHGNVQTRTTGNAFSFTKITADASKGYAKTEGNAGRADDTTTATIVTVPFKLYSSEKVTISQEMLDDSGADIATEITSVGMAKSTLAFGRDAVAALESLFDVDDTPTYTDTADTHWDVADLEAMYFEVPTRNRYGLRYICNSATAAKLVALMNKDTADRLALIGFTAQSLLVDDAMPAGVLIVGNPTLALAVGRKEPVRIFVDEVSEGRVYELQPRLAVAGRDSTAVAARKLKAAA